VKLKSLEIKVKPHRDFDCTGWESFTPAPGAKGYSLRENAPDSLFLSILEKIKGTWTNPEPEKNFITVSVDGDGFIAADPPSDASRRLDSALTAVLDEHDVPHAAALEIIRSIVAKVPVAAPPKKPPKKPKRRKSHSTK